MRHDPLPDQPHVTLTSYIEGKSSQTLLEYLCGRFKYLAEGEWLERISSGAVRVNDRQASHGQPLRAGDEVSYTTSAWEEPQVNTDYRILHEDEALVAVSKPAPLPVHAIGAYFKNTLVQLLRRDRPEAKGWHPVHRLDSETSGLILLVKDPKYLKTLQRQITTAGKQAEGSIRKIYRAIVFGKFPSSMTRLEAPIGKKEGSRVRMKLAVNGSDPKDSTTEFTLLESKGNPSMGPSAFFSLVEARPLTGRTHQIRVHLEHLGFPIVGDKLYSGDDETFLHFYEHDFDEWLREKVVLPRAALHAHGLEFTHPVSGERVSLRDDLPKDLADFWNAL